MPSTIIGKIAEIETDNIGSIHEKKVVTIKDNNETSFVEFRGSNMLMLEGFKEEDTVIVSYINQGRKTPNGLRCNNLVAQTIIRR